MGFGIAWNIHIHAIYPLETMMLKVILLESDRHGHTNREVSKYPKPTVVDRSGEGKIVAELMDS